MELYQLKTFVVVAEEGHLTRAAERLHASQPTISAHIKALEDELETRLFIRTPKGMRLTEAGSRLRDKAGEVLRAARELKLEARNMGGELVGDLSIGLNTDAEYLRIVPLLNSLATQHSKITLQILQSASTAVQGQINQGKLDCGFIFGPPRHADILTVRLETTRFFVAVPDIWKDRIKGGLAALAELPWIMDPSDNPLQRLIGPFFSTRNLKPAYEMEVDGDEVIRVLVAAGKGVSFLRENELKAANRIGVVHAVPFEELSIDLHFVCLKRRDQDPVMRAVIDHVRKVWGLE
ncbi:MAG: LysR family transcriptional regulator [Pseudodesulfovibrio sp.]|uniref:LysR substrate-binding protein n=1 Tax=Pseudodesulfovibrio aespoeensis (strain ATCC 700646 / DSM 10631 / Aspo-2) TaxID=643562 RepID=E6VSE9_PSEA9|nr:MULTISPECIES: LysR family transcriptional regulator [Pseudodesulfovibrio]MBU4192152.1 LysR family transcriptional regulator [Pseudomonadota bacterium]ADU64292.1 LysR substrate-binding protein [Pseudodesulfovibrio aespoeensis Aspo-2]MBU4242917.1 LysR family transcriptional regulator [Pseudomonadota bacterium]MBU4378959.1 LysR family transcriptional regulator [Pseudomonadota bacterium]MBU4474228.1 LysR family transcriptional regulator [Pseudomonadota bacterium]